LGFYISGHPLDKFATRLKELNAVDIGSFEGWRNNQEIVVGGIIVQSRAMRSRRGAKWAIVTLQDRTGAIEALVFPEAFGRLEQVLKPATALLVKGKVAVEEAGIRLMVAEARALHQVAEKRPQQLRVRVDLGAVDSGTLDRLHTLFSNRPGRCRVTFDLITQDGTEAVLESQSGVNADRELLAQVREICGAEAVALQ
jgi:DNA polymerase-3 subunit alpha